MAASWKTLRVFISSTFRDMHAERDHLVRFVFPKLREVLVKNRIHLIDVDLRWGVTSEQDSVAACREVIDECHPRFMGMLGGRYGWVPPESDQSITEDEVHYGVLERDAELRGNAFFYFRDDAVTASIIEKMPGDFRELAGSKNARKLVELKQSIVNARLPTFTYGAHWDANQERLTGLEAFGDHVFSCLLKNIQEDPELDDHFASETTDPSDEFAEEREAMEAFIEDRTERYVVGGRQALLDKMTAFAASNSEQNIFVVEGEPGSGKSSLLGKLCRLLVAQGSPHILIFHFVGASVGSTNLRRTLRRLCHELAVPSLNNDPVPEDIRELIELFSKLLSQAASRQRVVLVMDAINQFDATDGAHFMAWLPLALPPNIRIIASSLEHPALASLRRRSEPVRIEQLESLSNEDAHSIIQAFLLRYSKRFSAEQITALLSKPEGRLPLYILTALQELRTLGTYEEITARIRELPGEAKPLFAWILKQRLSNDPGFRNAEGQLCGSELVAKFASCLGASRHGLSQEELIGLLDPGDPLGNVAALLRLLRPYLMHRGELIDFFHNQLREAVEEEYLHDTNHCLQAHQWLAVYFHDTADPNREGGWKGTSVHALSELVFHQVRAEAWPQLVGTLENIFFLEAKARHGMSFDLVLNFSDAITHFPQAHPQRRNLRLLEEALRRDLHLIAREAQEFPQLIFERLWNDAWWYDCSDAAFHYKLDEGEAQEPPWKNKREGDKLCRILERWRTQWQTVDPGFIWKRSLRPPILPLGVNQVIVFRGHQEAVTCVAMSPDGRTIVSGSTDKTVRIWDAETGRELLILTGHEGEIFSVAFSPDGSWVVSGSGDRTVRLWDTSIGRIQAIFRGHQDQVKCVASSSDGRQVVSGSTDKTVRMWDLETGNELAILRGHEEEVSSVAFSQAGHHIYSGSADKTIRIWNILQGCEASICRGRNNWSKGAMFSPDAKRVISGPGIKTVRIWDAQTESELISLKGHEGTVTCVAMSHDGRRLLSGAENRSDYFRDGTTQTQFDTDVRMWDAESGSLLSILRGHEAKVNAVAFSCDDRRVLTGSDDKTIRLWNPETIKDPLVLRGHTGSVKAVDVSPDGRRVASASHDKTIKIWSGETGRELDTYICNDPVGGLAFSPDGGRLVSIDGSTVRLWDVESGKAISALEGGLQVNTVAFSPDGLRIAVGSGRLLDYDWLIYAGPAGVDAAENQNNLVRLMDAHSGELLFEMRGHRGPVYMVTFSADGSHIISWGDGMLAWETETGRCLGDKSDKPLFTRETSKEVQASFYNQHVLIARKEPNKPAIEECTISSPPVNTNCELPQSYILETEDSQTLKAPTPGNSQISD